MSWQNYDIGNTKTIRNNESFTEYIPVCFNSFMRVYLILLCIVATSRKGRAASLREALRGILLKQSN